MVAVRAGSRGYNFGRRCSAQDEGFHATLGLALQCGRDSPSTRMEKTGPHRAVGCLAPEGVWHQWLHLPRGLAEYHPIANCWTVPFDAFTKEPNGRRRASLLCAGLPWGSSTSQWTRNVESTGEIVGGKVDFGLS
jgi:hypothetical protein